MGKRLDIAYRTLATGLCFAVFAIGGLTFGALFFPILFVVLWHRDARGAATRQIIKWWFGVFIALMRGVGVLTYELNGIDRLSRDGLLVIANHPTLIDVVFLVALMPRAVCVVKSALLKNPVMRMAVLTAQYIFNDEGLAFVRACGERLKRGQSLMIFPEGTRSQTGAPLTFKRGVAFVAVRYTHPLTPVVISCVPPTLRKGEKWYQVPETRPHFSFTVHDDISPRSDIEGADSQALAVRTLNARLERFFEKESRRGAV